MAAQKLRTRGKFLKEMIFILLSGIKYGILSCFGLLLFYRSKRRKMT
jgi:hypothetical protein